MWFNGPFHASVPDRTIFRSKLKKNLSLGEKVVADSGYEGDLRTITPNYGKDYAHKRAMKKLRARHEMLIQDLKIEDVLTKLIVMIYKRIT